MNYQILEEEIALLHERICSALGDPTRILILYLLADLPRFVNEISEMLDLPQSTVSRHLRVLRDRNLVETERQGTAIQYSLKDHRIVDSLNIMREILAAQIQSEAAITGASSSKPQTHRRSK